MSSDLKRLSKFLAVMLRHKPEAFGLTLDSEGYAPLDDVWIAILEKYGSHYHYNDLEAVVAGDETGKKRYEISGDRIRALYGHSKPAITYTPAHPPERLYHGTTPEALAAIRQDGLNAQRRQYVHLTTDPDLALTVARRRTNTPILLTIRAQEAHAQGVVFYHPEPAHYLAKSIPAAAIFFP